MIKPGNKENIPKEKSQLSVKNTRVSRRLAFKRLSPFEKISSYRVAISKGLNLTEYYKKIIESQVIELNKEKKVASDILDIAKFLFRVRTRMDREGIEMLESLKKDFSDYYDNKIQLFLDQ